MITVSCPACGCNHEVPESSVIGLDSDSMDLMCDDCSVDYDDYSDTSDREDFYLTDAEADADVLASAGFGVDEDYGDYDSGLDYDFGYDER